ncbi:MAG: serine hydrolase [Rikenellaceae bacterium]
MKHFLFIFILLLQACGTLWRGTIYNSPNVGDSKHFHAYEFTSNISNPYHIIKKVGIVNSIDLVKSKTDYLIKFENDTLFLLYGDENAIDKPYELFSISKSVINLLLGIAINEGLIGSVDDNINSYITGIDKSLSSTTIRELLQMRSGINNNFYLQAIFYYGTNLKWSITQIKVNKSNVGIFQYSDCSTQLLAFIIENVTHKTIEEYFHEKLWVPLEMVGRGSWTWDSKKHKNARAFCGLSLPPINLIKIANLVINNGIYNDKIIIPTSWIDFISIVSIKEPNYIDGHYYNYHWRCLDDNILYAKGLRGQYLFINRKQGSIYLRLGRSESKINWLQLFTHG